MATSNPSVSIIVPTFKRRADLLRLLASVVKSEYPTEKLEIVVVDNAGDLSKEDIQRAAGRIKLKLLHPNENLYCSGGRFYGVKRASGQYFFFIDDDNVIAPDCIRHLIRSFGDSPKLGVVAPLMLFFKDKERIWAAGVKLSKLGRPIYLYENKYVGQVSLPELIPGVDAFPNAFMVKKNMLEEVPFDVANFPHNWSEADFGLRVKKHGYTGAISTKAREWHDIDYEGLLTRTDRVKVYDQAKSRILFRKRFFSSNAAWLVFWGIIFPISSLYYLKAILRSPDKKKSAIMAGYIKGTLAGIKSPIMTDA